MRFESPWWLALLPLALAPLWVAPGRAIAGAWLALLPRDAPSDLLDRALRAAAAAAIAALALGLASPYQPEHAVQRMGRGAEIVLLLDRSRSMDQGFAGGWQSGTPRESKGKVARQILAEFAARRPDDRFGMVVFSTLPMPVLAFTQKPEVVQAAIAAGNIGRGLSETDIGLALQSALSYFADRPYTGSRLILLVSDGGDHIEPDARERIVHLARRDRVGLTWLYIRSARSPGLLRDGQAPPDHADTVPEHFLHRFFESLGTPYRAYEAGSPEALQQAIDDVDRLENLPLAYQDVVPRRDLSQICFGVALACVLALLGAELARIGRWGRP